MTVEYNDWIRANRNKGDAFIDGLANTLDRYEAEKDLDEQADPDKQTIGDTPTPDEQVGPGQPTSY